MGLALQDYDNKVPDDKLATVTLLGFCYTCSRKACVVRYQPWRYTSLVVILLSSTDPNSYTSPASHTL